MPSNKIPILYIAGCDRSGSTVIDQILGQIPGWFTVGELADIWDRGGLLDGGRAVHGLCGCGSALKDCDFWRQVFIEAFHQTPGRFDFAAASALRTHCARFRHLLFLQNTVMRGLVRPSVDAYVELTRKLYQAIGKTTGAKVIVDSSKHPSHAHILKLTGAFDLFVVHLLRDPRGCAYSWLKPKPHPDPAIKEFPTVHPARTSVNWMFENSAIRTLWGSSEGRYLLLRYEDFIARPEENVSRIIQFVGQPASPPPFLNTHALALAPGHGVSGNTIRFEAGPVRLKLDDKWRTAIKPRHRWLVTALTSMALPTYGYDFGFEPRK